MDYTQCMLSFRNFGMGKIFATQNTNKSQALDATECRSLILHLDWDAGGFSYCFLGIFYLSVLGCEPHPFRMHLATWGWTIFTLSYGMQFEEWFAGFSSWPPVASLDLLSKSHTQPIPASLVPFVNGNDQSLFPQGCWDYQRILCLEHS